MALKRDAEKRKENLKILELEPDATKEDIRKAYTRLALKCHPDKNPNDPNATGNFQRISKAYDELTIPLEYGINICSYHAFECGDDFSDDEDWTDEEEELLYQYKQMFMEMFSRIIFSRKFSSKKKRRPPTAEETEQENFFDFLNKKYKEEENEDEFVLTEEDLKKFHSYEAWESEQNASGKKRRKRGKRKKSETRVPQTEQPTLSKKQLHAEQRRREQEMKTIGEELSKKILKENENKPNQTSSSAQLRKSSTDFDRDMEIIQRQQEEKRKHEEAIQERLRDLDGQEKSQNKKQKRKDKKAQRKQQKMETLKSSEPDNTMEVEEDTPVHIRKSPGFELPVREIKRPKVTRNHTAKSSVLQSYFKEPAKTTAPERFQPVSVVSDPGHGTKKSKGDPALLEKHLKMYNDLMKVQPQRHTEQQLRLEREAERRQLLQKHEEELNKMRGQYKTETMTFSFHDTNNNNGSGNQDSENSKGRDYYLQKHREMEKRRNAEEDLMNRAAKKSVAEPKKKPATKWYQMDISKPDPIYQEPIQLYEPQVRTSPNIWQKRAVEQERKTQVLSELLPETEEEETRMLRLALRASMETASQEQPRCDEKPAYRQGMSNTQNWDRGSCKPGGSIWETQPEPAQQPTTNMPDLHSAVLARQRYWEQQQQQQQAVTDNQSSITDNQSRHQQTQSTLTEGPQCHSEYYQSTIPSFSNASNTNQNGVSSSMDSFLDEDWSEIADEYTSAQNQKRGKSLKNTKNNSDSTFGIQQNKENRFNVLEHQKIKSKTKHNEQNTNNKKETLKKANANSQKADKKSNEKKSKVAFDRKKDKNNSRDNTAAERDSVTVENKTTQQMSVGEIEDWDESFILPQDYIVEVGDTSTRHPGAVDYKVTEDWDMPHKPTDSKQDVTDDNKKNPERFMWSDVDNAVQPKSSNGNISTDPGTSVGVEKPSKQYVSEQCVSVAKNKLSVKRIETKTNVPDNNLPQSSINSTVEGAAVEQLSSVYKPTVTLEPPSDNRVHDTNLEATENTFSQAKLACESVSSAAKSDTASETRTDHLGPTVSLKKSTPACTDHLGPASNGQSGPANLEQLEPRLGQSGPTNLDQLEPHLGQSGPTNLGQLEPRLGQSGPTNLGQAGASIGQTGPTVTSQSGPAKMGQPESEPCIDQSGPAIASQSGMSIGQSGSASTDPVGPVLTGQSGPSIGQPGPAATGMDQSGSAGTGMAQSGSAAVGMGQSGSAGGLPYGLPVHLRQAYLQYLQQSAPPTPGIGSGMPVQTLPMYDPMLNPLGLTSVAMLILQQQLGSYYQNLSNQQSLNINIEQLKQELQQRQQANQQPATQNNTQMESTVPASAQASVSGPINISTQDKPEPENMPLTQDDQNQQTRVGNSENKEQNKVETPLFLQAETKDDNIRLPKLPCMSSRLPVSGLSGLAANLTSGSVDTQSSGEPHSKVGITRDNVDNVDIIHEDPVKQLTNGCTMGQTSGSTGQTNTSDQSGGVYLPPHKRDGERWKPKFNRNVETDYVSENKLSNTDTNQNNFTRFQIKKTWDGQNTGSHDSTSGRSTRRGHLEMWKARDGGLTENDVSDNEVRRNPSTASQWGQTEHKQPIARGGFGTPSAKIGTTQDSNIKVENESGIPRTLWKPKLADSTSTRTTEVVDYRTVPARRGGFGIPGRRNKTVAKKEVTMDDSKPSPTYENFSVTSHGDHRDYRTRGGFGRPTQHGTMASHSQSTTERGDSSWKLNGPCDNQPISRQGGFGTLLNGPSDNRPKSHRGGFGTPNRNHTSTVPGVNHVGQSHQNDQNTNSNFAQQKTNNTTNIAQESHTWSMLHTESGSSGLNARFTSLPTQSSAAPTSYSNTLKARKERSEAILEMLKGMRVTDNEGFEPDNIAEMQQRHY